MFYIPTTKPLPEAKETKHMETKLTWQQVTHGSNWAHRKTGKKCIVQSTARSNVDSVKLLHESGRLSRKQVHYFLDDFKPLTAE